MIMYIANESYGDILRSMGVRKYKITLSRLAKIRRYWLFGPPTMTPSLRTSIRHIVSTLSVRLCCTLRLERSSTKLLDLQSAYAPRNQ